MRTSLSLLFASLFVLSGLTAMPVQAAATCPAGTPTAIESPTTFQDGCYHQYLLYNPDTPEVDVLILPPATANNAVRDITLIEQGIAAWDAGIDELAAPWFRDGFDLDWYRVGIDAVPNEALWDPELIVVSASYNPVRFGLLGIGQEMPITSCHGLSFPITSEAEARAIPNLHWHPDSPWASARAECGNGGYTCFVINMEALGNTELQRRWMYDLNSHEFGHCLGIGHVGDATDFTTAAFPAGDIMAYAIGGHVHCVSTLDVRSLEYTYAHLLGQAPNRNTAGRYMRMHPSDWADVDCAEPTITMTDLSVLDEADPLGEPKEDDDGTSTEDGDPLLTITSPASGAVVDPGQAFTIAGTVDRDGATTTSTTTSTSSTSTSTGPAPACIADGSAGALGLAPAPPTHDLTAICLRDDGADLVLSASVADMSAESVLQCNESPVSYGFWLNGAASPIEVACFLGATVANWEIDDSFGTTATASFDYAAKSVTVTVPKSELASHNVTAPYSLHVETYNGPGVYGGRPMWLTGTLAGFALYADRAPDSGSLGAGGRIVAAAPPLQAAASTASTQCSGTLPTPTFLTETPRCSLDVPAGSTTVTVLYNTTYTGLWSAYLQLFDPNGVARGDSLADCPGGDPGVGVVSTCVLTAVANVTGTWYADLTYQLGEATEDYTLTMVADGPSEPSAERVLVHDGPTLIASSDDLDTDSTTAPTAWSAPVTLTQEGQHTLTASWVEADGTVLDTEQVTVHVAVTDPCAGVTTGPVLSDLRWHAAGDRATITWRTDVASSSLVNFGASPAYGQSASRPGAGTFHNVTLTGLDAASTYHYQVVSARCGHASESADNTFTTTGREASVAITAPIAGSIVQAPLAFAGDFDTGDAGQTRSGTGLVTAAAGSAAWAFTVQGIVASPEWARLVDELEGHKGFLGVVPDLAGGATATFSGKLPTLPATIAGFDVEAVRGEAATLAAPIRAEELAGARRLGVADALADWRSRAAETDGPAAPELANGIGPGSAMLQGVNGVSQLCTLAYILQDPRDPSQYYGATAGHCLLATSQGIDRTGEANPGAVMNHVEVCYAGCLNNALALGSYVVLERTATYEPVAYASAAPVGAADAEGIGRDFGLLRIPKELNEMLRPWMPQWGGPDGQSSALLSDVVVHYGHGSYCCPSVGSLSTRTPVDQGRAGVALGSYESSFFEVIGWLTGGDSGSPSAIGAPDDAKGLRGADALGVNTHGIITGVGFFDGTLLSKGQSMVQAKLGFTPRLVESADAIVLDTPTGPTPAIAITAPAAGATLDAADGPATVTGTATFPAGAGLGTQAPLAYYLHRPACGGATDVTTMDRTPAATAEDGSGCGNLAATRMAQQWTSTQDPGTEIPAGSSVTANVKAFGLRPSLGTVMTGTLRANGATVGSGSSAPTDVLTVALALTDCVEFTMTFTTTRAIAAADDLVFAATTNDGTQDMPVCYDGGTDASRVVITPRALPVNQVQVSVDDASFGPGSLLPVTGATAWSATWDLDGASAGEHVLRARLLQDGVPVGPVATRTVTVAEPAERGLRTQLRLDGPGGAGFDWTTVGTHDGATTGSWSHGWAPDGAPSGEYTATARLVRDAEVLATATSAFVIDQAPTLDAPAAAAGAEGEPLSLAVTAQDPDGDAVTLAADGLPEGASFDGGVLSWTPTHAQAGTYTVRITAADAYLQDEATLVIDVADVNRAPVLSGVANHTVRARELLTFTVSATDPDGDAVTLSATGLPAGAVFDAQTGQFSWMPSNKQASKDGTTYAVSFTATDGQAAAGQMSVITVTRH